MSKPESKSRGRPVGRPPKHDYDINTQQRKIPDTPENVAKAILASPPDKK